jgi:hypothetical protein
MAVAYAPPVHGGGAKATVQRIGGHLAGMVMPNLGAFIAWGLITALFIPTGWLPNANLAALVGPMITVLLPVLIGYTGGRLVHGQRGAVVGAVATVGVVIGSTVPMFFGAMIVGPLAAFLLKHVDRLTAQRTRAGFEMLVDNFTAGIIGGGMAVAGVFAIGPVVGHHRRRRQRRQRAGYPPFPAAGLRADRAGQGAVPQQRHQPRRARPARGDRGHPARQVDPVHARDEPLPFNAL